jgi:transketolase
MTTNFSERIRRSIIDESQRAQVGHIGSALSIADIVATLYGDILNIEDSGAADRDRFVLSKGHAALALYAALEAAGRLSPEVLSTYCSDGSQLGAHPEHVLEGVDFSTGSLGQGLSIATGAALAARMQRSKRRVFALLSDAECDEGAVWEAAMFASHNQLSNLVAIVDVNGQQALGYTCDVLDLTPLDARWRSFGWDVHVVDGHDPVEMRMTIEGLDTDAGAPHVLLAQTTFGKGVSYMENQIEWHYWPMDQEHYERALEDLAAAAPPVESSP